MPGRFVVRELSSIAGKRWGIEDLSVGSGDNLVRDWRKKGNKRMPWKTIIEREAHDVCSMLNGDSSVVDNANKRHDESSKTRAILNTQRSKRPAPRATPTAAPFHKCATCGSMVKGDHICR